MGKLAKQYYYKTSTGEKKLQCYKVMIPKEIINQTNINPEKEIKVYTKDGKIIIEKV